LALVLRPVARGLGFALRPFLPAVGDRATHASPLRGLTFAPWGRFSPRASHWAWTSRRRSGGHSSGKFTLANSPKSSIARRS
jgi:hypothetical protein